LQPHSSAAASNFQRGAALSLQRKNWEAILFCSHRKISANLVPDSISGQQTVSALQSGDYHRTASEMADRNSLGQFSSGAGLKYRLQAGHIGINVVYWKFSLPFKKADEPYKLFGFEGQSLYNASIDYSYSWKNMHAFGEMAIDPQLHEALVGGMLISLEPRADLSLLYRNISGAYQSVNANAFTTNSAPANEKGVYAGLILRPTANLELSGYSDFSVFPWLKYRVNMPSNANEYWLQLVYTPSKQSKLYARFRSISSPINQSAEPALVTPVAQVHKKELQLHTELSFGRALVLRQRVAMLCFRGANGETGEGFLAYEECFYHPVSRIGMAFNFRMQYFETSGYDERLFVYESDLPYHFSIPFFYGRGWRYYLNAGGKMRWPRRKANAHEKTAWHIKWAQTIYPGLSAIGDGPDRTEGNRRSEISLQFSIPIM